MKMRNALGYSSSGDPDEFGNASIRSHLERHFERIYTLHDELFDFPRNCVFVRIILAVISLVDGTNSSCAQIYRGD